MKNENDLIFNSYAHALGQIELTEAEQVAVAKQQVKQKFQQQLLDPKTQQAMLKQAEELKTKYQKDIVQAMQKDGGKAGTNVEELLKKIQAALNTQAQQQVKESVELEEGIFDRVSSLASGAVKRAGDVMNNKPSDKGFRQEAILKRFQSMQKSVGSHLKELQRDMETTSGVDTKVKDAVNKTIANIESKHGIAPTSSKFQDVRHGIGKFVQNVTTGALLAAPVVALAAPIAAAVGLGGAAAAAVTAGISGGSVSVLKDLITGQKPNAKRAAVTALAAAATAGLFKMAADHITGAGTPAQTASPQSTPTAHSTDTSKVADMSQTTYGFQPPSEILTNVPDVQSQQSAIDALVQAGKPKTADVLQNSLQDIVKDWPHLTKTVFGRMTNAGTPTMGSEHDVAVLKKVGQALYKAGKQWSDLSPKQQAALFNPIAKAVLRK